jgi:para-nitrobenzyl esterase
LSADRALLVGHTSHDWSFFVADQPWYREADDMPEHDLFEAAGIAPDEGAAYRRVFPRESARLVCARILTDRSFGAVAAALADEYAYLETETYRYEFAYETDAWPVPLGATHCVEIPFVFMTTEWARIAGCRPDRSALAAQVSGAWLDFAASRVPRTPSGDWPRYRRDGELVMRINTDHWQSFDGRLPATS